MFDRISRPGHREAFAAAHQRLLTEFGGDVPAGTIDAFLDAAHDQFLASSRVRDFVPLLAERFARQRLEAWLRIEHDHAAGVPVVLFLCTHNAGRSQMALGFFDHYAAGRADAWSGGSAPCSEINPRAVAVMAEHHIDLTEEFPKPWSPEGIRAADVVVTMGGDDYPQLPGKKRQDWPLEDPDTLDLAGVRRIRDEIESRVIGLLDSLGIPVAGGIAH